MTRSRMRVKTRKAINRSGIHPCAICGEKHILHSHHIRGRRILRANRPSNIADVCPNCHTKVHEGQIVIEGWVESTSGKFLAWHSKGEEQITSLRSETYIIKQPQKP